MKLKRKTAQLFVDLYKRTEFVLKVKNASVKEEADKVDAMLSYCNSKSIPLLATPAQLNLLNDYMQNGNSYLHPRSKGEIFRAKLYLLNVESIIENSLTRFINLPVITKKRRDRVEESMEQLNDLKAITRKGVNSALTDILTEKVRVKKRGKEYNILKPRDEYSIRPTIEKNRALLENRIALYESEISNIINLNKSLSADEAGDFSYLMDELSNVKNDLSSLNIVASSIDGIVMENKEGIRVVNSDIEAFCESNNAISSNNLNVFQKLNKKLVAVVSVTTVGFLLMTGGYIASEKMGLFNEPPAVVDVVDPAINPAKDPANNNAIAQYIILHKRFDTINLNDYTLEDINGDYDFLTKEAEREISEMDKAEIISIVNNHIKSQKEGYSLVEFYDGLGYTSESSEIHVKDGENLTISFNIDDLYEYNGETNQLQILNGTAASIKASVEGDKIVYKITDLQVEKDGQPVIFNIGDLSKKQVEEEKDVSIVLDQSNSYGVFSNIPNISEVNIKEGVSFDFKPNNQYNQTTPIFKVDDVKLASEKNKDNSYTYEISYDVLKNGGEINVVDASDWQLNNYNVSYIEGDGWKFETMPNLVPHGRNFYIFVSVKPEYKGVPVLYINGTEVEGDTSGEYGLIKFKISTTEDIEITGSNLEQIINIETRSNGNVGQASTNDQSSTKEVDTGGTSIGRG